MKIPIPTAFRHLCTQKQFHHQSKKKNENAPHKIRLRQRPRSTLGRMPRNERRIPECLERRKRRLPMKEETEGMMRAPPIRRPREAALTSMSCSAASAAAAFGSGSSLAAATGTCCCCCCCWSCRSCHCCSRCCTSTLDFDLVHHQREAPIIKKSSFPPGS